MRVVLSFSCTVTFSNKGNISPNAKLFLETSKEDLV